MLFCKLLAILSLVLLMSHNTVQSQHSLRGNMRKANEDKQKLRVLNSSPIKSQPYYYYHGQPKYEENLPYNYEPELSLETPDIISSSTYYSMLEDSYSSSLSSQTPSDMSRFSSKETEQDSSLTDDDQDLHDMDDDDDIVVDDEKDLDGDIDTDDTVHDDDDTEDEGNDNSLDDDDDKKSEDEDIGTER